MRLTAQQLLAGARSVAAEAGSSFCPKAVLGKPSETEGWTVGCRCCGFTMPLRDQEVIIRALVLSVLVDDPA